MQLGATAADMAHADAAEALAALAGHGGFADAPGSNGDGESPVCSCFLLPVRHSGFADVLESGDDGESPGLCPLVPIPSSSAPAQAALPLEAMLQCPRCYILSYSADRCGHQALSRPAVGAGTWRCDALIWGPRIANKPQSLPATAPSLTVLVQHSTHQESCTSSRSSAAAQ